MRRLSQKIFATISLIALLFTTPLFTSIASAANEPNTTPLLTSTASVSYEPCTHPASHQMFNCTINIPGSHTVKVLVYIAPIGWVLDNASCSYYEVTNLYYDICNSCGATLSTSQSSTGVTTGHSISHN